MYVGMHPCTCACMHAFNYVDTYAQMCISNACTHTHTWVSKRTHIRTHTYICLHTTNIHTYPSIHPSVRPSVRPSTRPHIHPSIACLPAWIHIHMHASMPACMRTCIHPRIYANMCSNARLCKWMYVCLAGCLSVLRMCKCVYEVVYPRKKQTYIFMTEVYLYSVVCQCAYEWVCHRHRPPTTTTTSTIISTNIRISTRTCTSTTTTTTITTTATIPTEPIMRIT